MKRSLVAVTMLFLATLAMPSAGWSYGQPAVNLGFTSFVDGAPPSGPGFYFQEYIQYYTADKFKDFPAIPGVDPELDVWVSLTQLIYQSDRELLFGGKWGMNVMLPVVSFDLDGVDNPFVDLEENDGIGDILVGPYLQWDPIMGANGPVFMHRIELQLIFPTGDYDDEKLINPGSNFFSFNPYWAATAFLTQQWTVSWRLHYLWNDKNEKPFGGADDFQAGQAVHANFTTAYEVIPKQLRLGVNGYWFKQITDNEENGDDVGGQEKVFAIGPGLVWHFNQDQHLFINAYKETSADYRPEGERVTLRYVHHF